ncbi:MAG TPA: DUF4190 domain-containing protein [Streptomyces sp.]|nr:DUF4190 domain-containing protein [Streptomyces sp.]
MSSSPSPQGWAPYGTAPGARTTRPRNGVGIAALVLGLLGLVLFWTVIGGVVLGLPAVVSGVIGRRRGSRGEATNGTMALIGAIAGGLALVVTTAVVAAGVSFLNSEEFGDFEKCVDNSDTAAERQRCEEDFRDDLRR